MAAAHFIFVSKSVALSVATPGCDPDKIAIAGGEYRLSNETNIGSRVRYTCPKAKYPHPAYTRECLPNGQWSYGNEKSECRAVQCPRPVMFDNGVFNPQKDKYFVGHTIHHLCMGDSQRIGTVSRTCQANGIWSEEGTKCDDLEGDCPNPGIPYGATKVGSSYKIGDRVTYECQPGLQLLGSKERECMKDGHWSGAEPSCRYWYAYDAPKTVAEAFSASLSEKIESSDAYKNEGLRKKRREESFMNIFIIIDGSKRLGEKNFQTTKEAGIVFIEKMATFDFTPRYGVISFASSAKPIVQLSDNYSTDAQAVIDKINTFKYTVSKNIRGFDQAVGLDFKKGCVKLIDLDTTPKESDDLVAINNLHGLQTFKKLSCVLEDQLSNSSSLAISWTVRIQRSIGGGDSCNQNLGIKSLAAAKSMVISRSLDGERVQSWDKSTRYADHEGKQGRNIRAALAEVHEMLTEQNSKDPKKFLERRNVILLMTYGKHNMGGEPMVEMKKIRKILDIRKDNDREDYLDVYVFGVANDIDPIEINDLASKKDHDRHVFKMKCENDLKRVFVEMLNGTETSQACGLSRPPSPGEEGVEETYPWIAKITITRPNQEEKCKGSVVSKSFILTAAHCFHLRDEPHNITVRVGGKLYRVKNLHRHDKYNPLGKQDKKVAKSYDYDVALIELTEKIQFSRNVSPICLPCTTGTSWALRQRGKSVTCRDHAIKLLFLNLVRAMFIAEEKHKDLQRKDVIIKTRKERIACLNDTKNIPEYGHIADIKDLITDRFFCTGGIKPQVDPQTCKADAGGPLIVPFKQRYVQVGVISWGTINSCTGPRRNPEPVPALSRDFHINLYYVLDWLKEKLGGELEFLI
ncbi:complement factor B-like [Leptodactylus fuscus]